MTFDPDAPVFDSLIALNSWAKPFWEERRALIEARKWNVSAPDQGGNVETQDWLRRFIPARSAATLALLSSPRAGLADHVRELHAVAQAFLSDPEIAGVRPGAPMQQVTANSWLVNGAPELDAYTPGMALADVLLLGVHSLRKMEVTEPLDIGGQVFPLGLNLCSARLRAPLEAGKCVFGPFSDFSAARFDRADFREAEFHGVTSFAVSGFGGDALFSFARFLGHGHFHATGFDAACRFEGCRFEDGCGFDGALFATQPDFTGANFDGDSSFADAAFNEGARFEGASFPGRVYVGRIPKAVRDAILAADHP